MKRNTNPSTLREMSGADGNVLRRLYSMSRDGIPMFDERNLTRLRYSAMDGTKNKRRLLKIPDKYSYNSRLCRILYAFSLFKFMSIYRVKEINQDNYSYHLYTVKYDEKFLRDISRCRCLEDNLCDMEGDTPSGYFARGKIHLCRLANRRRSDFM